jgi:thiamine-phosphate pyrophosphorylase
MKPLSDCLLYAFVDTAYLHGRTPDLVARQLCDGGADLIQLRAKGSPQNEIRQMAEALRSITRDAGVGLVVNDFPAIAQAIGADFCHLGQEDFVQAGDTTALLFGLSTHSPIQATHAVASGAGYLGVGPVFPTATKPQAKPVTLDFVRWAAANVSVPWFAIGGINLENLDEVLAAGARRVCVVSAILNAPDIRAVCREFKSRLGAVL